MVHHLVAGSADDAMMLRGSCTHMPHGAKGQTSVGAVSVTVAIIC